MISRQASPTEGHAKCAKSLLNPAPDKFDFTDLASFARDISILVWSGCGRARFLVFARVPHKCYTSTKGESHARKKPENKRRIGKAAL
jgi:hypothetical protein